ncbi:F-box-like protein [Ceratobasidium sp. AG-Ba]|nr:F-box-like protein [Ceratobasidium sp. AG-Ba]
MSLSILQPDYPIASEESLMGTMDIDADFATYDFARERLQSAHAALCTAAQEYLAASLLVRSTYSDGSHGSDKPPQEREAMLQAIDTELATIPSEIETISLALSTIKSTRDQSKMVAPIYSLPSELLARIFCDASCRCTQRFVHYSLGSGNTSPTVLSGVCRRWRAVALSHLSLWTHLDLVVSRRDTGYRYPSSELWLERLQDAPLYVNIRQYHTFDQDEWDDEELENDSDDERNPAEMVTSLLEFLSPLMIQMRSLNIRLGWPGDYILTALLDRWKDYGVSEYVRILKAESNLEIFPTSFHPRDAVALYRNPGYKAFFQSLEVLHLHNVVADWRHLSLQNLTELDLKYPDWTMLNSELVAVIVSCPRLERLALDCFIARDVPLSGRSVKLSSLRELSVKQSEGHSLVQTALGIVDPGYNTLTLNVAMKFGSSNSSPAKAAFYSFVARANVKILRVFNLYDLKEDSLFASQIDHLPRVEILVLHNCHFSRSMMVEENNLLDGGVRIATHHNPKPVNSSPMPWPSVRQLYLVRCIVDQDYTRHVLSGHSIQALYTFNCFRSSDSYAVLGLGTAASEEDLGFLRELAPKVVYLREPPKIWFRN